MADLDRLGKEWVRSVLDRLAPDQRDVLLLRVLGDLTVEQVAETLGKSVGAVKQLQRRGVAAAARITGRRAYPCERCRRCPRTAGAPGAVDPATAQAWVACARLRLRQRRLCHPGLTRELRKETGATAYAVGETVAEVRATWVGAAVIVDALSDGRLRGELGVRALLHARTP